MSKIFIYSVIALTCLLVLYVGGGAISERVAAPTLSEAQYSFSSAGPTKLFKNFSITNNDDGSRTLTIIGYYQLAIPAYGYKYVNDNVTITKPPVRLKPLSEFGVTER